MTLLIIGIVLLVAGGACVYFADLSATAAAAIVAGVYGFAKVIKSAMAERKKQ